nr:hypothetical protein [Acetobacterium tundrae]
MDRPYEPMRQYHRKPRPSGGADSQTAAADCRGAGRGGKNRRQRILAGFFIKDDKHCDYPVDLLKCNGYNRVENRLMKEEK